MAENNNNNQIESLKKNFNENKPAWIAGIIVLALIVVAIGMSKEEEKVALVDGCSAGAKFNTKTGEECPADGAALMPEGCEPGYKYSVVTGVPCPEEAPKEEVKKDEKKNEPVAEAEKETPAPAPAPKSKYPSLAEALKIYAGDTFKVGTGCAVTPESDTVARGTRIMVHNDTTRNHTVLVGSQSLILKPYYYRTVVMSTAGEVSIKCDGKPAATVTVK